jgi:antitoxin ParD1/3/4
MSVRANKPVSVTLGQLAARAEARVKSGAYSSLSEVVRAGLRALDREEAVLDRLLGPVDEDDPKWQAYVGKAIAEALDDPRPSVPVGRAFAEHDKRIARYKAERGL